MAPKIVIEPISENKAIIILSSGIIVEVSDSYPLGGEVLISETAESKKAGKVKRISIISKGMDETDTFHVEVLSGGRGLK